MSRPGPEPDVPDGELITAIENRDLPFATASDVAEVVGLSRWRTTQRLTRLADEKDELHSGKVGEKTTIYWLED